MSAFYDAGWYALERDLLAVTERITEFGFPMNRSAAIALMNELIDDEAQAAEALQAMLPPIYVPEIIVPKRSNKTKGYIAGVPFSKHKLVAFNPNSGPQFVDRMTARYGTWPSPVLTKGGSPSTTAAVLQTLPWREAAELVRLKIAAKRITMLSGDNGYLTKLGDDDKLHTTYHTLGAVTGRASHQPNVAQVPGVNLGPDKQPLLGAAGAWGVEFRSLFVAPDGMVLVGADLVGLEARIMGHYLAIWDNGAYAQLVCADVDLHALNQQTTGVSSRAAAKRLFYATCYGCGHRKAGSIADPDETDEAILDGLGKVVKQALIGGISGFGDMIAWLDGLADDTIPGLDGRPIHARKRHARVNTLIQSAGAVVAKRWLVLTDTALQAAGLRWCLDYAIVGFIHDEIVVACRPEIAEQVADTAKACAVAAGEYYHLDCPMKADAKIGASWACVH